MSRWAGIIVLAMLVLTGGLFGSGLADEYKLGVSATMTGPVAGTFAPSQEGLRIYIDRLNDRGGVNGRKINLVSLDNRGEPSRAVSDSKRLVEEENVLSLISVGSSATYAPMVAAAKKSRTPLVFLGSSVCPGEVYPPKPDPNIFCSSFNMLGPDSRALVHYMKELSGGKKVKVGLVAMDVPVSREGVDLIEKYAKEGGLEVVGKVAIPGGTADLAPFATRFTGAGATMVSHWAPFELAVAMFTSLNKQGWTGNYLATASALAETNTAKFRQENFYVAPTYSFSVEGLPAFREIAEAAKKYKNTYPVEGLTLGWVGGLVIEDAIKRCGWPCKSDKLRDALENVKVDTLGLYGGPLDWSAQNHVRSAAYYRLYRWDSGRNRIVRVKDWLKIPIE